MSLHRTLICLILQERNNENEELEDWKRLRRSMGKQGRSTSEEHMFEISISGRAKRRSLSQQVVTFRSQFRGTICMYIYNCIMSKFSGSRHASNAPFS